MRTPIAPSPIGAGFQIRGEERDLHLAASGHTVIVVSHATQPIVKFRPRAMRIENGRILREDNGPAIAAAYLERLGDPGG